MADLSQWKEYAELNIDLMSASVAIDSALQSARDLIQETRDSVLPGISKGEVDLQMTVFGNRNSRQRRARPGVPGAWIDI
jgi:hypothetical protein